MFWGLTPALNFFDEIPQHEETKTINILIVGGADARHILKTLAEKYKHKNVVLQFYIMESIPEVYAKQLLLLNLALQPAINFGAMQKVRVFMEIYGNMIIRAAAANYVTKLTGDLIEMVTNADYLVQKMPFINLDLKYKERDYIENVFKFWISSDKFDVLECWDHRLRKMLGVRYDTRIAAFDWDLHMTLHHAGAKYLNTQEYQSFRRNGVAFSWLESEVSQTNRTMVTGILPNGDHFGHYGYLGDMQTGPFIAYGIECCDETMLAKTNNTYKYRSTDIAERNLREIFHKIEFGTEYTHTMASSFTLGSTLIEIADVSIVETRCNVDKTCVNNDKDINNCLAIPGMKINFVSMKNLNLWKHKQNMESHFDAMYFACSTVKNLDKDLVNHVARDKCVLIVENPLFSITHREKDRDEHLKQVEERLIDVDKYQCPLDLKKDSYIKYVLKKE